MLTEEESEVFMEEAYREAEKASQRGDYAIGAVIVLGNEIVSRSGNEVVTRGVPYAHAEFLAMDTLRETKLDVIEKYREMSVITTIAPCPMCFGRILVAGFREVVYGAPDPPSTQDYEEPVPEVFRSTAPEIRELGGDLGEKCNRLFLATRKEIDRRFFGR
jgi:tRNA(Arg) A34 adenosine deaminase TadA